MSLSASHIPRIPGISHSTFESLRLGRNSQSIAVDLFCFLDSLNFKKDSEFMGITVLFLDEKFISTRRANHYMLSLKFGSIEKVVHLELLRCSSMYKINDHSFLIRFIPPTIIDEVITGALEINLRQIRSVQGSGLTKETTRVVIRLLIDP
uniref:DUF223 domain-containing protein n=1 Tax=Brassica campestris TaxID=3711 RepID=M4DM31_BRACM